MTPEELVEAGERYARAVDYPIQYQWTLIEGVNDGPDEIEGIVRLLQGKYAIMNMIPYNTVPELGFRRPAWEKAAEIARTLHRRHILTKLRNSAGQEVDGGCGQLRARERRAELARQDEAGAPWPASSRASPSGRPPEASHPTARARPDIGLARALPIRPGRLQ